MIVASEAPCEAHVPLVVTINVGLAKSYAKVLLLS